MTGIFSQCRCRDATASAARDKPVSWVNGSSLGLGGAGQGHQHVLNGVRAQLLVVAHLRKESPDVPDDAMVGQLLDRERITPGGAWRTRRTRRKVENGKTECVNFDGRVVGMQSCGWFTCSSSSDDSSSLSSMTTSLPSSSSCVFVFFFLGFGGSGGSCHIIGCQQREPSRGVGVNSTKRYKAK